MKLKTLTPGELALYQGKRCYHTIMENYIANIRNPKWKDDVLTFLTMERPISTYSFEIISNWDFSVSPGSGAHHTHFGGLALHTLQNLEYAEAWTKVYQNRGITINKDLLYCTILIHDTMKRFIYRFDDDFNFIKKEDPFIAKKEDHHSWVLRELTARDCDKELILSVASIHGIDDVALETGVKNVAVVNHYLAIGNTGLTYNTNDIRPEHVISFLADSDWHWSGQAQAKTGNLAELLAKQFENNPNYLKIYLGSRFSYEIVGKFIEENGVNTAVNYFSSLLASQ